MALALIPGRRAPAAALPRHPLTAPPLPDDGATMATAAQLAALYAAAANMVTAAS